MDANQAKMFLHFFIESLQNEHPITKKVLLAVPDSGKDYRPDPKARTTWELACHIAESEVWFLDGIINGKFSMPEGEPPKPAGIVELVGNYERDLGQKIEKAKGLSGEHLATPIDFFGFNFPTVMYLNFMLNHTIHHRGQLSAYLRPVGSKVPDIYGGSADEPFQMSANA